MIDLSGAINIAKDFYYERGQQKITKIYETDSMWIIYGGKGDQPKIGGDAITISKENGDIGSFHLPSKENFAILRQATLIDYTE